MDRFNLIRLGAIASLLTFLLGITIGVLEIFAKEIEWIYILFDLSMLLAFTSIFRFLLPESGALAIIGYTVIIGGMIISFFDFLLPDILWRIGSSILGVGLILLAIGSLKAKKFPLWIPILWIIAAIIGVPGLYSESFTSPIISIIAVSLFSFGFIGSGYKLWITKTS